MDFPDSPVAKHGVEFLDDHRNQQRQFLAPGSVIRLQNQDPVIEIHGTGMAGYVIAHYLRPAEQRGTFFQAVIETAFIQDLAQDPRDRLRATTVTSAVHWWLPLSGVVSGGLSP